MTENQKSKKTQNLNIEYGDIKKKKKIQTNQKENVD